MEEKTTQELLSELSNKLDFIAAWFYLRPWIVNDIVDCQDLIRKISSKIEKE